MVKIFKVKKEYLLSNGVAIPSLGLGTWKICDQKVVASVVKEAIDVGYKHIDTAAVYNNEEGVGEGIRKASVSRENLFVTSKVWNDDQGYDNTIKAFNRSLEKLGLKYLDLYLIHWPVPNKYRDQYEKYNYETWKAMEYLYEEGKVRAIGVSNFQVHHLKELLIKNIKVKPMVNQIEVHPLYFEYDTVNFCIDEGIYVEGYSPLMRGNNLNRHEFLILAEKYNKTPAQICLRWSLQKKIIPLPKTTKRDRLISNLNVYDFELSSEDMKTIDEIASLGSKIGSFPDSTAF